MRERCLHIGALTNWPPPVDLGECSTPGPRQWDPSRSHQPIVRSPCHCRGQTCLLKSASTPCVRYRTRLGNRGAQRPRGCELSEQSPELRLPIVCQCSVIYSLKAAKSSHNLTLSATLDTEIVRSFCSWLTDSCLEIINLKPISGKVTGMFFAWTWQ